jgi:hypothetical protein
MKHFARFFAFSLALLYFVAAPSAFAQNADGDFLLTENGLANPEYSHYKNAPLLKTGGTYYASPAFDKQIVELGENGIITAPTPFARGILTNGDASTDYKRRPMPYAYWSNQQKGTLYFDLKKNYFISKVRVQVLQIPKIHGIAKIGVYTWDEMLEAGSLPLQEITAQNGWNEFAINKTSDKIKLDFTRQPDAPYMTITEVEIWGRETAEQTKKPAPPSPIQTGAPRHYRAFDFGPTSSPVFADFTPVDSTAVYNKDRGYGWIPFKDGASGPLESNFGAGSKVVPGLLERDRGVTVKIRDDLYRDFVGAQRAYYSQLEQEFAVDVKNGKYFVAVTSGDLVYGQIGERPLTISAEGRRVLSAIRYNNDLTAHAEFEVTVTDGQLNLRFSSDEAGSNANWNLSGLLIFPDNTVAEKQAALTALKTLDEQTRAQRQTALATTFTKIERMEPDQLFALTPAQRERGYLLFARDWMEMIYPNTIPQQREVRNAKLSLACAPGEYEPATLGVYPLAKNLSATVETSDLVNEKREKIGKENISLRLTGYLNERMKNETRTAGEYSYYLAASSWGTTYMEKVPKVLWPLKGKIEVDETRQIWLTVHVPENAKPGRYNGTLTFKPQNHPAQTVAIQLTVYPLTLHKSERVQGMYWNEAALFYPQNRQKELDDMARHGIRAVVTGSFSVPELKKQGEQVAVDFTRMDALVAAIKKAGLMGYMPFLTASTEINIAEFLKAHPEVKMTQDDAYKLVIAQTFEHAKANHWPEILFYPVDEIGNGAKYLEKMKHLGALIRAAAPDAKIYCTVNNFAAGLEAAAYIDYACVNIPLSREQEQQILQSGKAYMRYGNSYNYNPRLSRTVSGFGFWRLPAVAMYYWHYLSTSADPFNALDGGTRDWVSSYPTPDGPVNSIDFEAIREGIDDTNYIATMQNLMAKARQNGKAQDAVKQGQTILDEITAADPSYNQYDLIGVPNEKYHQWRSRMAQVIIQLQGQVK